MEQEKEVVQNEATQQDQEQRVDLGISEALKGLVSEETLSKFQPKEQPVQQEEKEVVAEDKKEEVVEQTEEKKEVEQKEEKVEKKNVFGISGKKQEKKSDIVIENTDHILDVVKSKFGQDIKDIKDLPKFFETTSKWREDSQKLESVSSKVEQYENVLSSMPEDIIESMKMFLDGQDYTKAFLDKPKFNFDLTVDKQAEKDLVNHYFPGKFTDEDFEEEASQALEIATTASKDKYNAEKQARDNQRATIAQNAQRQVETFKKSVGSSVDNLKKSFPDVDKNELQNIHKTLEGGVNSISALFFNNDGTVKESAAESLMLAIHGKSVIADMMEAESHVTETKINEDLLSRGNETRKPKHGNGVETISDQAKKVLADLNTFKEKSTF